MLGEGRPSTCLIAALKKNDSSPIKGGQVRGELRRSGRKGHDSMGNSKMGKESGSFEQFLGGGRNSSVSKYYGLTYERTGFLPDWMPSRPGRREFIVVGPRIVMLLPPKDRGNRSTK